MRMGLWVFAVVFSFLIFLLNLLRLQIWSSGVGDDAALGRPLQKLSLAEQGTNVDESICFRPLQSLIDESFRAVQISAGDNINAAINEQGDLKVWGSFRVR